MMSPLISPSPPPSDCFPGVKSRRIDFVVADLGSNDASLRHLFSHILPSFTFTSLARLFSILAVHISNAVGLRVYLVWLNISARWLIAIDSSSMTVCGHVFLDRSDGFSGMGPVADPEQIPKLREAKRIESSEI
jgi:hypothetical protein